ncbi:UPF0692 protein C19orf54 homolog [Dendronephthya gigantea]|uniref:UPF0692 protein C19orf54 homolog n=1 Tax=Dendronephthya gigantea TaxID=151771 RepID=UPI00106AE4DE|nr:UPF0692 protein C19orf54 homolog [Dendronephthya gigantea]
MPYAQGKNLMKSAATLIGQDDCKSVKESALNACQRFLGRYKTEECGLAWFYHNNDVDAFLQDGPTCGLVALKLAANILRISQHESTNEIEDLLKVAQVLGFTNHGEMFSAQDMGLLAKKYYKLNFEVDNNGLDDYGKLIEHLCKGYSVVFPYDEDRNHEPCLKRGHKAHWAVLTGFLVGLKDRNPILTDICMDPMDENKTAIYQFHAQEGQSPQEFRTKHLFLIARQGKSRHYALWHWTDLNNSNKNLFEFVDADGDLEESERTNCVFTEGVQAGLCSKVVFLFPNSESSNS